MKVTTTSLFLTILILLISQNGVFGGKGLFDELFHFKEKIVGDIKGLFDKDKCDCPCREYYVPKCEMTYVQQCQMQYYEEVCTSVPVYVTKRVTESDCQRCRKFSETVPTTEWVVECNPVYDEHCSTEYQTHCSSQDRCVMIYQTVCSNGDYGSYGSGTGSYGGGYKQQCKNEHCYPETKCHKTPQTQCVPVKKENCNKVERPTTKQEERKECLPYERTQAELEAAAINAQGGPCPNQAPINDDYGANTGYGPSAPSGYGGGGQTGYGGGGGVGNSPSGPTGYAGGGSGGGGGGGGSSSQGTGYGGAQGFSVDASDPHHGASYNSGGQAAAASPLIKAREISNEENIVAAAATTTRHKKMTFPKEKKVVSVTVSVPVTTTVPVAPTKQPNPFLRQQPKRRFEDTAPATEYQYSSDEGWRPIFSPTK